jgi:hypothetical protein
LFDDLAGNVPPVATSIATARHVDVLLYLLEDVMTCGA